MPQILDDGFEDGSLDAAYSQYVSVQAGIGEGGGYGVDWDGTMQYGSAGFDLTVTPGGIEGGTITARYKFNASRLQNAGAYYPLVTATVQDGVFYNPAVAMVITNAVAYGLPGSVNDLYIELDLPGTSADQVFSIGTVSEWADDDWHTVSLCWWDGSSDTAEDGRVIGKLDGDTIFDVSNVAVWVNGDTWVRAAFGHEGLAGIVDNVKAWDDLSQCGVTEVVDSSVPCCTTCACTTTPGTIPAGATGPILPTITPLWTPACVGGGTVLTVSDLAHTESWAD